MISRGVCVLVLVVVPMLAPAHARIQQLTQHTAHWAQIKQDPGSKQESWPWHTNIGGDDAHFLHRNIVFANNYAHANNVVQMSAARVRLTSVLWCLVWPAARAGLVPSI